jgi:hypothetical protein
MVDVAALSLRAPESLMKPRCAAAQVYADDAALETVRRYKDSAGRAVQITLSTPIGARFEYSLGVKR